MGKGNPILKWIYNARRHLEKLDWDGIELERMAEERE